PGPSPSRPPRAWPCQDAGLSLQARYVRGSLRAVLWRAAVNTHAIRCDSLSIPTVQGSPVTQLALDGARATMLKISINVLGKDADNTLFTLPIQGIELSREELNRILGDRTFEAWYQQKPDKSWHPMDFWHARKNGSFEIDQEFTADALTITVSGNKDIEFETVEAEGDDDDDRPAATIDSLVFKPTAGGVTLLSLHL